MSTVWDPSLYLDFDDHRSRPFHDLLARVGAITPRTVVDLGCGPGHLTALLATRWPDATITALDSSAEMVAAARERGIAAEQRDVLDRTPLPEDDVVIINAVLQRVPSYARLLPRWVAALPAGAWFALQVPGNLASPSHVLIRELADEPRWRTTIALRSDQAVPEPATYAERLVGVPARPDGTAWFPFRRIFAVAHTP